MKTGKRQHHQDIYSTDKVESDDFTPQVSKELIEERKRDFRRHQFSGVFLGATILLLSVGLIYVIAREYLNIHTLSEPLVPITKEYVPRYSLPSESQWVLDFSRDYGSPRWDGEGDRPFTPEWVRKAAFNLILAEQAARIKEFNEAIEYYEDALKILPDLEGIKIPLGTLYFQVKDFEKALALLEDLPESEMTPDVLNNLGAACINAKAYDRAEAYLKRAIEDDVTYAKAYRNMAKLYEEQTQEDKAIGAYEKYIDLQPMDLDTQHAFALYLTQLGKWKMASDILQELTAEMTDVPVLFLLLAQVENNNNEPKKAIKALQRYMELSDPNSALAYMNNSEFEQLRKSEHFKVMIKNFEASQK